MNPGEVSVFFVDDDPGIRRAVQKTMESAGIHVNVFVSAEDCLAALSQQTCDVLITDVRMEGMDGISLLRKVRRSFPWLPTIIATAYGDIPQAVTAIKAGAVAFIEKPLDRQELLSAVREAIETSARPDPPPKQPLSDAERQVLRLILDGKTNREISEVLNRSVRTIEAHRHSVMRKFGVKNVAQLVQRANALGFGWDGRVNAPGEDAQHER
jgi:two-component system response regulator FixJ